MLSPETEAYYQVHGTRFSTVRSKIDDLITESSRRFFATQDGPESELVIQSGLVTAHDILADYHPKLRKGISDELAEELADTKNATAHASTKLGIIGLQGAASIYLIEESRSHLKERAEAGEEASLLPYTHASTASINGTTDEHVVVLSKTTLEGVAGSHTAERHYIEADNCDVVERFSIDALSGIVRKVDHAIAPSQDVLLRRGALILGGDINRILLLVQTGDEDEINTTLNELWADYQGTAREEEVGSLLEELRQRIFAIREATQLNVQHNLLLPNNDKISQLEKIVNQFG